MGDGVYVTLYTSVKPTNEMLLKMYATAALKIEKTFGFVLSGAKEGVYSMVENFDIKKANV